MWTTVSLTHHTDISSESEAEDEGDAVVAEEGEENKVLGGYNEQPLDQSWVRPFIQ